MKQKLSAKAVAARYLQVMATGAQLPANCHLEILHALAWESRAVRDHVLDLLREQCLRGWCKRAQCNFLN